MGEVTTGPAADLLHVSVPTVRSLWRRNLIEGREVARKSRTQLLIDTNSINRYLQTRASASGQPSSNEHHPWTTRTSELVSLIEEVHALTEQVQALVERLDRMTPNDPGPPVASPSTSAPRFTSSHSSDQSASRQPDNATHATPQHRPAPAGTEADLRQALVDQRAVADALLAADAARADVETHLLAALASAAVAATHRNTAVRAAQAASTSLAAPSSAPPAGPTPG